MYNKFIQLPFCLLCYGIGYAMKSLKQSRLRNVKSALGGPCFSFLKRLVNKHITEEINFLLASVKLRQSNLCSYSLLFAVHQDFIAHELYLFRANVTERLLLGATLMCSIHINVLM